VKKSDRSADASGARFTGFLLPSKESGTGISCHRKLRGDVKDKMDAVNGQACIFYIGCLK